MNPLEEEAKKRKERLAAMKAKRGVTTTTTENPSEDASETNLKRKAQDEVPLPAPTVEETVEEIRQEIKEIPKEVEVDLENLAPKKVDWDLRRDMEEKLAKLERRTNIAIANFVRERLKEEGSLEGVEEVESDSD